MSLTKQFKTDKELETQGAKLELPPNDDGSIPTFYIARMGATNPKYIKIFEQHTKPHRKAMAMGVLPEDKATEVNIAIFVDALMTGWQNILTEDVFGERKEGEPLFCGFSRPNAISLLTRLPELLRIMQAFSNQMQNFLEASREDELKN